MKELSKNFLTQRKRQNRTPFLLKPSPSPTTIPKRHHTRRRRRLVFFQKRKKNLTNVKHQICWHFFQTSTRYVGIFFGQALDMSAFFMKIFFQKSIFGPYTVDNSKHLLNSEKIFSKNGQNMRIFLEKIKKNRFFRNKFSKKIFLGQNVILAYKNTHLRSNFLNSKPKNR